jgi:hypothetical protein
MSSNEVHGVNNPTGKFHVPAIGVAYAKAATIDSKKASISLYQAVQAQKCFL